MSHQERIEALRARHEAIDAEITDLNNRPHPDDIAVAELKKQKLRIKDEIESILH